jgi:hypothetical protein
METQNVSEKLLVSLIGMDVKAGSELCEAEGYIVRKVRIDSDNYLVTMDLRFNRINLYIDDNKITKCDIG